MGGSIHSVRVFAGTVDSSSSEHQGLQAPATLTLVEFDDRHQCKFVFFVGAAFPLTVNAPRDGSDELRGIAQDPRGWEVRFEAKLVGRRVTGSFQQPHDWGTFDLEEV